MGTTTSESERRSLGPPVTLCYNSESLYPHLGRMVSGSKQRAMKKVKISLIALGAAALLAWAGRAAVTRTAAKPHNEIAHAAKSDLGASVKATGVVRAPTDAEVRVGVQSPGVMRRLHVRVGDSVEKGQLLAEFESRALKAKCGQAEAAVKSAEANLRFETLDAARKRMLVEREVLATSELDRTERDLALSQAALAETRANLATVRAQLEETRVFAPISGIVASIATHEGENVTAGLAAPTLLTLINLKRLETWAYVDETDVGRINIGQQARFTVDSYPDREVAGHVVSIYPKPEIRDNVVDYIVVLEIEPSKDVTLRPEMTANVKITLDRRNHVLAIPRRAVHRELGRNFVFVPSGNSSVQRPVTLGARDDTFTEIVDGLHEGDAVLLGELPADNSSQD